MWDRCERQTQTPGSVSNSSKFISASSLRPPVHIGASCLNTSPHHKCPEQCTTEKSSYFPLSNAKCTLQRTARKLPLSRNSAINPPTSLISLENLWFKEEFNTNPELNDSTHYGMLWLPSSQAFGAVLVIYVDTTHAYTSLTLKERTLRLLTGPFPWKLLLTSSIRGSSQIHHLAQLANP